MCCCVIISFFLLIIPLIRHISRNILFNTVTERCLTFEGWLLLRHCHSILLHLKPLNPSLINFLGISLHLNLHTCNVRLHLKYFKLHLARTLEPWVHFTIDEWHLVIFSVEQRLFHFYLLTINQRHYQIALLAFIT